MDVIKQRAVNAEQKQQRIEQILTSAEARFEQASFSDIRLVDIAADVGITKAAFYRYFRKKELLFLALYRRHLALVSHTIERNLKSKGVVEAVTAACIEHKIFCKLSGILHTILEHNITVEEITEFKFALRQDISLSIDNILPYLAVDKTHALDIFLMMHHVIIGAWVGCTPTGAALAAIEQHDELKIFDLSFEQMLTQHLKLLITPYLIK